MGCSSSKSISVYDRCSGDVYFKNKDFFKAIECYKQDLLFLVQNKTQPSNELLQKISTCLENSVSVQEGLNFYISLQNEKIISLNANQGLYTSVTSTFISEKIAESYFKESKYEDAIVYLENLRDLISKSYNQEDEKTIKIENKIALCHKYLGNFDKALELYNNILKLIEQENKEKKTDLPIIYGNIASCYCSLGKFDISLEFLEKSLKLKQSQKTMSLAGTFNNFAVVYFKQGNIDKALEYLKKAESECLNNVMIQAKIYNSQVACFIKLGRFEDAEKIIAKYQIIYKDHSNKMSKIHLASYLNNLMVYFYRTGKIQELERCYGDFVNIYQGIKEESFLFHQYFITSGQFLYYKRQFTQALEVLLKAEKLEEKYVGEGKSNTIINFNNIGALYMILGDQEKADFYFSGALKNSISL